MTSSTPSGAVTFLFTDIEGSTRLWEQYPESMQAALARHDAMLRDAVETHRGRIVKTTGDGLHAVFANAFEGVAAVVLAQRALASENWHEIGQLRVRMALHSGSAEQRAGDYYGTELNRAARLMAVGHGGQVLLSGATRDLVCEQLPIKVSVRDLGEHRLRDLIRPEHVYQLVVADLPSDFPPLNSLNALPHNIPVQLTSFIGREREMTEVKHLLGATRLLTLTGPGGTGKTRLALQVAAEVLADSATGSEHGFRDGAWLVELAPLADPALVRQNIASVLGVREPPGRPLLDALLDHLRARQLLLLLDNCEHLIGECAQLAETLLHACPRLKILASSREALGIAGETAYRVPPLTSPGPRGAAAAPPDPLAMLAHYDAVRLFLERARAVQPQFELNGQNAEVIAQICERLDGIPLAIELAGARTKLFSVEEIAARLDDRFRLLTGGSRTALPRQQTLRALVDWSYDLLSEPERELLRRLSVFAGGWTFEQAERVCADDGLSAPLGAAGNEIERIGKADILELLALLVNKSLVSAEQQGVQTRYRFLETIRQYARERLLEAGESEQVRDRHLQYFTQLARDAESELRGPHESEWSARIETELDNIRAALEWSLASQPYKALQILGALAMFWSGRGFMGEGRRWSEQALAKTQELSGAGAQAARAKVLAAVAGMALGQGDTPAQYEASVESVRLYRELGRPPDMALALALRAIAALIMGELEIAQAATEEGLALARASGRQFEQPMLLAIMATAAAYRGDPAAAGAHGEEAIALARQTGSRYSLALSLMTVAMSATQVGDYTRARAWLEESQALYRQMENQYFVNASRGDLANIARLTGDYERALELYRESIRVWQHLGQLGGIARSFECLAFIAGAQGQLERAGQLFGAAEALRAVSHMAMEPQEQAEYTQQLQQIRAHADEASFASAVESGRTLTLEQAVAYALADG